MSTNNFKTVSNVFSTTTYDFELYKSNRVVNRSQKKAIAKSIKKHGNLTIGLVALINGIYYIIDGQHRYTACKEDKTPFEFKLIELENTNQLVDVMKDLNSNGKNWRDLDYLLAWAKENKQSYKLIKEVNEDFKKISFSNLQNIFGWKRQDFRNGTWVISKREFNKKVRIVSQLNDVFPIMYFDGKINAQPLRAVIKAMQNPKYKHEKMVKILAENCGVWSSDEKMLNTQLSQYLFGTQVRQTLSTTSI